jgi:hypothetical protein
MKRIINILAGIILLIVGFEFVQGSSMEYWGVFINENEKLGYFLGSILLIGACFFFWRGLKAIDKKILFRYLTVNIAITAVPLLIIHLTGSNIKGPYFNVGVVLSFPGFIFLSLLTGINNVMHFATDKTQMLADVIVYSLLIGTIQRWFYLRRNKRTQSSATNSGNGH